METNARVNTIVVGCGGIARHHIRKIIQTSPETRFMAVCEPSIDAYVDFRKIFDEADLTPPPNEPDLTKLLAAHPNQIAAAIIATPHAYHFQQAKECLDAGINVFLEKPMVLNAQEAEALIKIRDSTQRHLVVAFQSSLSPHIRHAVNLLKSGELGKILNINAMVWQGWTMFTNGTWRQQPEISGGGFFFDTGAHMLNTVAELAGEDFIDIAAWFDNRGRPVDILGVVIGRLKSGTLVTMNACGDTIPSCSSDVRVFCEKAILKTGVWGGSLQIQKTEKEGWIDVPVPETHGDWSQFLAICSGKIENLSPPEIGLRMARLWDAIKTSAANNGAPVKHTY